MLQLITARMKQLNKIEVVLYDAGAVIMVLSLLLLHTELRGFLPYIYGVGAALFFVMQLRAQSDGGNVVIRRLRRQQMIGALLLLLAAPALWMEVNMVWPLRHNEWIVVVTIGAWMELYTAFRLPKELEREKNDNR